MNHYEAMFVFDSAVTAEWTDVEAEVNRLLERIEATLVVCKKWDERRFAYDINRRWRGVYAIVFFKADGGRITELRRDARLSEQVLRLLVLRNDHMTEEQMLAVEPAAPETDRDRDRDRFGDRGRFGDRDRDRDRGRGRDRDRDRDRPRRVEHRGDRDRDDAKPGAASAPPVAAPPPVEAAAPPVAAPPAEPAPPPEATLPPAKP